MFLVADNILDYYRCCYSQKARIWDSFRCYLFLLMLVFNTFPANGVKKPAVYASFFFLEKLILCLVLFTHKSCYLTLNTSSRLEQPMGKVVTK